LRSAAYRVGILMRNSGKKPITGLAFHPSGRYLAATSGDATVRLHDREANWVVTRAFDWRIGALKSVAFHPEGTRAAAGGAKGQVVLWDVDL
jgi:WD40 repeat protein